MGKSFRPEIRMTSPRMMIPAAGIQIIRTSRTSFETLEDERPRRFAPAIRQVGDALANLEKRRQAGQAGTQVSGLE